jgi:long-chain acyl-CoA synthetase
MILNDILLHNVQTVPNKIAAKMQIGFRTRSMSYLQTYLLAQKVATLLEQNNIQKGDPVLICAPNSPFWGCVFWGCLLKGAVIVPLNVQSTANIIELIIAQTNAKIIFDFKNFKHQFVQLKHYHTDFLDEILENLEINFTPAQISEQDLVQIMYTSGTTGNPKGVMLSHKNISSNLQAIDLIIHPDPNNDRILSILPLSHIYEQTIGFLLPYLNQVEIIYTHNYSEIRKLLSTHKVTKMLAVPEFLQVFMAKIESGVAEKKYAKIFHYLLNLSIKINRKWFSRILFYPVLKQFGGALETIASGGAPLSAELERKWNGLGIDILQGYGLTETSPVITTNTYTEKKVGSVGKPLSNVLVKLDDTGQILAKGPNVFMGYYKNETKTNEVLVDGWFNTEDIGEFDEAGFLYIKGRKKYMILTPSGQNVYPEDLENILNNLPGILDSCVISLHDKIHAVLLLDENYQNLEIAKIIETANHHLTSYQQINSWSLWPLEDFPRTATRKVKKNEVEDFLKNNSDQKNQTAPTAHSKLVKILAQITKTNINLITPNTKIIGELNLDSLGRVELIGSIEEELRVAISEQDINLNTTVHDLEELIKIKKPISDPPSLKKWPRMWWAKMCRVILQNMFLVVMHLFVKLKIEGQENLNHLKKPAIFMPNHLSFVDPALLNMALPFRIRNYMAFAAARDFLYQALRWIAPATELIFNSFPIQREDDANIKLGLEYIGKMLDSGYYVTVFPEGKISKDGTLLPLKLGAGMIATTMDCQIVPVKISGIQDAFPYNQYLPRKRALVTVKFGKPLDFKRSTSFEDAKNQIQAALANL